MSKGALSDFDLSVYAASLKCGDVYGIARMLGCAPVSVMSAVGRLAQHSAADRDAALASQNERRQAAIDEASRCAADAEARLERRLRAVDAGDAEDLLWMRPLSKRIKRVLLREGILSPATLAVVMRKDRGLDGRRRHRLADLGKESIAEINRFLENVDVAVSQ